MAKVFKWLVIALVALVGMLVALVVAVMLLIDPNDYRDDISRLVYENTGQELVIEGDIRLSFFPWLGLDLGRTRLENREGFGDQPFVQIESAGVAVRVLPLFRREVVMDVVRLDGLLVHLIVNEQGEANWDLDLPESEEEVVTEPPAEERPEQDRDRSPPIQVGRLGGVEVTNMRVIYEDRQQGGRQELGPVNVYVGELDIDRDVPVDADWVAILDDDLRMEGGLSAKVRVNAAFNQVLLDLNRLEMELFGEGLPSSGLRTRLDALVEMDLEADTASVTELSLNAAGLRLLAEASISQLTGDPRIAGRFEIPETDLREVLENLEQEVPETADEDVLKRFTASGRFAVADDAAEVEELQIVLDDTTLAGTVSVREFANPMIGFNIDGDSLNADRYLPPPSDDDEGEAGPAGDETAEDEPVEIPVELLRDLRLDGSFRLGELTIMELLLEDLHFTVQADNGQLRLHPVGVDLYGGEYRGDIRVDARGEEAIVRVNERITGVQARQIVQQLMGSDLLMGTGNVTVDAQAQGRYLDDVLRTLAGEADFSFRDGAVQGLNLAHMMRSATSRLQGQRPPSEEDVPRTDFTEMVGRIVFEGGKIRNESLNAQSPLFRVSGGGEVDMLEQTVDYRLTVNLVGTLEGQDGQSLDNLRRLPIPLRFRGDLFSPSISLDLQAALTDQQRERLREEEQQLRERAAEEEQRLRDRAAEEEDRARERVEEERERLQQEAEQRARDELRRRLSR
ncbi:MAG: AsmA family protein [Ectothiorhodospiraceae bacterium]|nr:AsmA family protein [Ectothiorhodospiraceae bacterium]